MRRNSQVGLGLYMAALRLRVGLPSSCFIRGVEKDAAHVSVFVRFSQCTPPNVRSLADLIIFLIRQIRCCAVEWVRPGSGSTDWTVES